MAEKKILADRYKIQALLGYGGMAEVYRGIDTQTGKAIAIKKLKREIIEANPDVLQRFTREGESLRQLNHPNIVKMLDAFEASGEQYLIMELVQGGSLADLLHEETKLSIERVLAIALELADALTRAHHLGIIHRDIKPSNVLMKADGVPCLTDFGIARTGDSQLTKTDTIVGTIAYLSPEAISHQIVDTRTDIWAFGVMLFELLTGQLPFCGTQAATLIHEIMTKPVPNLIHVCPDTPPGLAKLVGQMLQKQPDDRIPSVRQVGASLEAIIRELDSAEIPTDSPLLQAGKTPSSRFATPTPNAKTITPVELDPPTTLAATAEHVRTRWWVYGGGVAVLAIVIAVVVGITNITAGEVKGTAEDIVLVDPVGEDKLMVLVAELESIGNTEREVSRFIFDDLKQRLEVGIPFSDLEVRLYPEIITSHEQAQAVAKANQATIIIWGNYTESFSELNFEFGVLSGFPYIEMPLEQIEAMTYHRYHITNERQQSLAPNALAVLVALQNADGDGYEALRTIAILDLSVLALWGTNLLSIGRIYQSIPKNRWKELIRQ